MNVDSQKSTLPAATPAEFQLKRILAPTDFSECSRKAVEYAVSFAKRFNAELVILHVFESPPPQTAILEATLMDTSLREDMAAQLERWRQQVSAAIPTSALMRDGTHPHKEIVAAAKELRVGLIVIGHHGRKALARAFMGSNADKIVRSAPCPVLVVHEQENDVLSEPA